MLRSIAANAARLQTMRSEAEAARTVRMRRDALERAAAGMH
jgi:hypothetical protein